MKNAERFFRGKANAQCHRSAQLDVNAYRPVVTHANRQASTNI